jgi:membrane fusion protein, heavy metal efflux system
VRRPVGLVESLALLLAGLCLVPGCGRGSERSAAAAPASAVRPDGRITIPPDSPQTKQIRVAAVEIAELPVDEVVAPGRVIANPNRIARVLPPISGRVLEVLAGLGSAVESGQPVVAIEGPDADAAVSTFRQAEATERQAAAALTKAQGDAERAQDLYGVRAIAEKDLLGARNDLAQAQGGAEVARAAREQASRRLELLELKPSEFRQRVVVRAPINGKVLEVNVAPGEYRAAISFHTDTTAPLMTIADLSTVWVAVEVPEPSLRLIRRGDPVSIALLAFPGETFPGRIARVADGLDPQTRTLKVYVELANPQGRFLPEMFGTVRHSGARQRTPAVPPSAIVQEYGYSVVFVERAPGEYERRRVTAGAPSGSRVPVERGLEPGERVVVDGAILLKDR